MESTAGRAKGHSHVTVLDDDNSENSIHHIHHHLHSLIGLKELLQFSPIIIFFIICFILASLVIALSKIILNKYTFYSLKLLSCWQFIFCHFKKCYTTPWICMSNYSSLLSLFHIIQSALHFWFTWWSIITLCSDTKIKY